MTQDEYFNLGMADQVKLEVKLDEYLNTLLGENFASDCAIYNSVVVVIIYHQNDIAFYREYGFSVLGSGLEAATEFIHLDWLFS
jgi:anaerobic ribonucleoside-triphosphate reductase